MTVSQGLRKSFTAFQAYCIYPRLPTCGFLVSPPYYSWFMERCNVRTTKESAPREVNVAWDFVTIYFMVHAFIPLPHPLEKVVFRKRVKLRIRVENHPHPLKLSTPPPFCIYTIYIRHIYPDNKFNNSRPQCNDKMRARIWKKDEGNNISKTKHEKLIISAEKFIK